MSVYVDAAKQQLPESTSRGTINLCAQPLKRNSADWSVFGRRQRQSLIVRSSRTLPPRKGLIERDQQMVT